MKVAIVMPRIVVIVIVRYFPSPNAVRWKMYLYYLTISYNQD